MGLLKSCTNPGKVLMLPILALEIRKGKSSSLLSLSPNGLPPPTPCKECANVPMCHPNRVGGGGGAPIWFENGHRLFAHFGLNSVMVFEGIRNCSSV